jgi:hypothetical protein
MVVSRRTLVSGDQIRDKTIAEVDLADNCISTAKIKDKNITSDKLSDEVLDLIQAGVSTSGIGRTVLAEGIVKDLDFTIPNSLTYVLSQFTTKVAVYRNGQLLFSGSQQPVNSDFIMLLLPIRAKLKATLPD